MVELGGSAPTNELLDLLETKDKERLTEFDFVLMRRAPHGRQVEEPCPVRPRPLAQRGRHSSRLPSGIWEITIQGQGQVLSLSLLVGVPTAHSGFLGRMCATRACRGLVGAECRREASVWNRIKLTDVIV